LFQAGLMLALNMLLLRYLSHAPGSERFLAQDEQRRRDEVLCQKDELYGA
jgi:hypothetical protein